MLRLCYSIARFLNQTSLLVVAASVICCRHFCRLYDVQLPRVTFLILPLSVWIIYTLDHVLDAARADKQKAMPRHRYSRRARYVLLLSAFAAMIVCLYAVTLLPARMLWYGGFVALLTILYLAMIHLSEQNHYGKELMVSLVMTLAVCGMPLYMSGHYSTIHLAYAMVFFMICLVNTFTFALFDHDYDRDNGFKSLATTIGKQSMQRWLLLVQLVLVLLVLLLSSSRTGTSAVMLQTNIWYVISALLYIAMARFETWFAADNRYRFWGDLVLCLPVIWQLNSFLH